MAQWQFAEFIQLLIGIVDIVYAVYKPRIAIGVWISQRHSLPSLERQDEVFGVEHVQHRIDTVAIDQRHIAGSIADSLEDTVHLWCNMCIDKFLIAAQFSSMIATDALQIVACLIFVEGRCCQVQHTVVERLILENMVNSRRLGHRFFADGLRHKHAIVQIAFVHRPHIYQADN